MNWAFGGPYPYSADLQPEGYLVRANDDVELVFDLSGNHVGQLVRANDNVQVQFNADNDCERYLVRANDDVTLRYDLDGEWIGHVGRNTCDPAETCTQSRRKGILSARFSDADKQIVPEGAKS